MKDLRIISARKLRRNQTDVEKLLWSKLRSKQINGLKFRRQEPIGQYIIDFICYEKKLIIELDGGQHTEEQAVIYDKNRTTFLENKGYTSIRFWNNEVNLNINEVMEKLNKQLTTTSPHLTSPSGEGLRPDRNVICLVGPIAAGKGVVVEYLTGLGYSSFSLSSIVREETERRGLPIERKILQDVGDSLRKEFGNEVLAKRTTTYIKEQNIQKTLIDGARNHAEVMYFKKQLNAYIIGITADANTRFKRVLSRKKESDPTSRGLFEIMDARDLGIGQSKSGNNVGECLELADVIIENNGTKEDFLEKLKDTLQFKIVDLHLSS